MGLGGHSLGWLLAVRVRGDDLRWLLVEVYDHAQPAARSGLESVVPASAWSWIVDDDRWIAGGFENGPSIVGHLGMLERDVVPGGCCHDDSQSVRSLDCLDNFVGI